MIQRRHFAGIRAHGRDLAGMGGRLVAFIVILGCAPLTFIAFLSHCILAGAIALGLPARFRAISGMMIVHAEWLAAVEAVLLSLAHIRSSRLVGDLFTFTAFPG
jgi:hypothetical protein